MRLVDRLQQYLNFYSISAYAFERTCNVSNGYLGKQLKGKGAIGSDILERIKSNYPDLSIVWLVTGRGAMLLEPPVSPRIEPRQFELNEEQQQFFTSKDDIILLLRRQVTKLEESLADKEKIIELLEQKLRLLSQSAYKKSR
jgi:hypothetical protein